MRWILSLIVGVVLASSSMAQDVTLPEEIRSPVGRLTPLKIEFDGDEFKWQIVGDVDGFREYDPDPKKVRLRILGYKPSTGYLIAIACKAGKLSEFKRCRIIVGDPGPDPDPKPPGPDPGPDPDPKPDPDNPPPIPLPGLRVLILYESTELAKLPSEQVSILYNNDLRKYLDTVCVKGDRTREWRIWDKDVDVTNEAGHWKNVMERRPTSIPWIIVSNGVTGFEGPLPKTAAATKSLIQKYEVK